MKHNIKITIILIAMFIATQLIGLFIVHTYNSGLMIPYGMQPPEEVKPGPYDLPYQILIAFVIAISLFFFLIKFKAETFIKVWFFIVTIIAIALALNVFLYYTNISYYSYLAFAIAAVLAYLKIFKRDIFVHNITELLIYPGIAAVFIPLLNVLGIIVLLFLISLYDIWAVWHTEFMQKMAKFQINNLRIFTGFFIPYAGKKEKSKIKLIKQKYAGKSEEFLEKQFKKAKVKINLAILGGGDVIFPIISAGIFYKLYESMIYSLIISFLATISLLALFVLARKGKFYPAMPFLTIGIYIAMIINWILIKF